MLTCVIFQSVSPGLTNTTIGDHFISMVDMPVLNPADVSNAALYCLGTPPHVQVCYICLKILLYLPKVHISKANNQATNIENTERRAEGVNIFLIPLCHNFRTRKFVMCSSCNICPFCEAQSIAAIFCFLLLSLIYFVLNEITFQIYYRLI